MKTISRTFAAGETASFQAGNYFKLIDCNDPVTVKFYLGGRLLDETGENVTTGYTARPKNENGAQTAFDKVLVSSATVQTIIVGISRGEGDVGGSVEVINSSSNPVPVLVDDSTPVNVAIPGNVTIDDSTPVDVNITNQSVATAVEVQTSSGTNKLNTVNLNNRTTSSTHIPCESVPFLCQNPNHGAANITTTAATAGTAAPTAVLGERLYFNNSATVTIYVGITGVTSSTGFPIPPKTFFSPGRMLFPPYFVTASGSADLRYWEKTLQGVTS